MANPRINGPLFKWFGSKWASAKKLPEPEYDTIIEPFAGGAGYSLRYSDKQVVLYESNKHILALWRWLIKDATQSMISEIPCNVPIGTDIRSLELSDGQALLLKSWQRTNNVSSCWTVSPWGNLPGQWSISTRSRVSEEFAAIRHWTIAGNNGFAAFGDTVSPFTWFIDPPYQYNYQYGGKTQFSYSSLAQEVNSGCKGQVIVCEAICQKTDRIPQYLPFEFWGRRITSRRKKENNHHSRELVFIRNSE